MHGRKKMRGVKTEGETQAVSDTEANLKSFCKYVLSKRKNENCFESANR